MDFDAYKAMLAEEDWNLLFRRLTRRALKKGRRLWRDFTPEDAQDAAQDVMTEIFDPATFPRWDPARQPSLFKFLCKPLARVINTRGVARARHAYRESQVSAEIAIAAADQEDARARRRRAEQVIELIRAELLDDPHALLVVGCLEEGLDDVYETADRTGLDRNQVYNARRRIENALTKVKRQLDDEEEAPRGA